MPKGKKKQGKGTECSPKTESVSISGKEGVRGTPSTTKSEQVSTEHLLASLRGAIKAIKRNDSVDRDVISALLMDLQVSERDSKDLKVSERDIEVDDEVPLDFEEEETWEEEIIMEQGNPQGNPEVIANPITKEEEFLSERHSPLPPIVARRLVDEMEEDDIINDRRCPENEAGFKPSELLSPKQCRERELLPYTGMAYIARFFAILQVLRRAGVLPG